MTYIRNIVSLTQLCNPKAKSLGDPLARPPKFFEPRPVNCNSPYPLHREIVAQSILLLGIQCNTIYNI